MPALSEQLDTASESDVQRFLKPGETVDQLYARSVREVQKWRKRRRWTLGLSWGGFILGLLGMCLLSSAGLGQAVGVTSFLVVLGGLLGLLAGMLMRPTRRNALNSLLQTDNVRAVGPLLEATQMMIPEISTRATSALIRLLPRLREEHADLLTPLQRNYLRSLIAEDASKRAGPTTAALGQVVGNLSGVPSVIAGATSFFGANRFLGCHSEALSVAVVQAMAYIGDGKDLELVQRIAANPVQQAALQSRSRLESRIKNLTARDTHLRAAPAPAASAEELVRPAQPSTPQLETSLLVRPAQDEPQTQSLSS